MTEFTIKMIASLGTILILGCIVLRSKYGSVLKQQNSQNRKMLIRERLNIGSKTDLILVSIEEKNLVISVNNGQVNTLLEYRSGEQNSISGNLPEQKDLL